MSTLVAYASKHGATEGIARAITDRLCDRGVEAEARPVHDLHGLDGVDAVVVGSAIYAGSWMKDAMSFVHSFAPAMRPLPVWLFSSGPLGTEVKDDDEQPKQLEELRELLEPEGHVVFFGALDPEELGFSERMIIKAVRAPSGDFRDWEAIRGWADGIAETLNAA
ncbi:MAG TPA: flavodoxin domain-containing protein [Actinomycetota bacterium]